MKTEDLRQLTEDELLQQLATMTEELVNLRIKLAVKQLDNALQVRYLRRDIARAKTILREKRVAAKPDEATA
jgi:large subunit ribosomal protein L29